MAYGQGFSQMLLTPGISLSLVLLLQIFLQLIEEKHAKGNIHAQRRAQFMTKPEVKSLVTLSLYETAAGNSAGVAHLLAVIVSFRGTVVVAKLVTLDDDGWLGDKVRRVCCPVRVADTTVRRGAHSSLFDGGTLILTIY